MATNSFQDLPGLWLDSDKNIWFYRKSVSNNVNAFSFDLIKKNGTKVGKVLLLEPTFFQNIHLQGIFEFNGTQWLGNVTWNDNTTGNLIVTRNEMDWSNGEVWIKVMTTTEKDVSDLFISESEEQHSPRVLLLLLYFSYRWL
jgi:hypothetical protein